MLTKEQMDALPGLVADATPGPWRLGADLNAVCTHYGNDDDFQKGGWAKTIAKTSFPIPKWMEPKQALPNGKLIALSPELAATVIEQQAEIERLRDQLGILWSWCRNWDAEFIYDDEFDRSAIESLLGATQ